MPTPSAFTARQIAAAAGVSKRRVLQYLSGVPCIAAAVRGQDAKAWVIGDLPADLVERLDSERKRWGFSSVGKLLENGPKQWEPASPLHEYDIADQEKARMRRDVIAPVLRDGCGLSVREMARRGLEKFREVNAGRSVSLRSVIRWTDQALERDRGRCEFDRLELYLPFASKKKTGAERGADDVTEVAPVMIRAQDSSVDAWKIVIGDLLKYADNTKVMSRRKREIVDFIYERRRHLGGSRVAIRRNLNRKLRQVQEAGGDLSVLDDRKKGRTGRKERFCLTDQEKAALRRLVLERGSFALAIEEFVDTSECERETRQEVLAILDRAAQQRKAPAWPLSLKRAGAVTESEKAHFRGRKKAQEIEFTNRRTLIFRDVDGTEYPMEPDLLWESDDYSCNAPYIIEDPERGGVRLCRQMLATVDAYTYEGISIEAIGRERDAYRAEDILRHMLRTIDGRGTMPRIWRLERGAWESQAIDGVRLPCGRVWGGLNLLFHVEHVFKSKGKPHIEGLFHPLQSKLDHRSATIGRSRGEFEAAAKEHMRINGSKRAWSEEEVRLAGFWGVGECAEAHRRALAWLNARPKARRELGHVSPDDLRAKGKTGEGASGRPLPTSERWRFCPVKRMATVRRGFVEVSVEHYPRSFRFQVNGVDSDLHLDHGYRVLVAFDPAEPASGCHIFNYEEGSRDRHGWGFAKKLLVAPAEEAIPMVDFSGMGKYDGRKKASAAARAEFRSIMPVGYRGYSVSQAQDGVGGVKKVELRPSVKQERVRQAKEYFERAGVKEAESKGESDRWGLEERPAKHTKKGLSRVDLLEIERADVKEAESKGESDRRDPEERPAKHPKKGLRWVDLLEE